MKKLILAGVLALVVGSVPVANATLDFNGTLSASPSGTISYGGGSDLATATWVTLPAAITVTGLQSPYNGGANDFISLGFLLGTTVTVNPLTLAVGGSELITFPAFAGVSETVNNLVFSGFTAPGGAEFLTITGTDVITAPGYGPTKGTFSASFNESSPGGSVGGSLTVSTVVPEPSTVIAGIGALIPVLLALRRRKA